MAPDRGEHVKPRDEPEQPETEYGSRLPFVLIFGICLYSGADRLGLLGASTLTFGQHATELEPIPCYTQAAAVALSTAPVQPAEDFTLSATIAHTVESVSAPEVNPRRTSSDEANPQHNAMLFLFNAIILGTMITQALHFRWLKCLQQTVVLFLFGVAYSLLLEGLQLRDHWGVFGRSYNMWMDIDPHLLLFTMLPPLLAGDAMSMDTAIARRVSNQWLYLAGPGVLINGFLTALFLWSCLPYDWPFLLCLTTGAILCATDPVAVVALLKELGAPPALTVQIQGESLLNDGTAIVLYQLTYNMLQGEQYDASDIFVFFVKTAACAWCLGLLIGWIFYGWIRAASNKLESHSAVIQISLTLCCAYWSFILSEGVFHMSGVLATVASSLVLADKMWPLIVCKESMHTVWHMFEYLGNIIVFFLAGALTGKLMVHMPLQDYFWLIVIYIMLMVIRGTMLLCSRPIMNLFAGGSDGDDEGVLSVADCIVMTWGGLRGAVGLALAIQVSVDKAGGEISEIDANRVLFYTGGVAALTLIVNATSCPALVKFLRIAQMPATKKRVLLVIHQQLDQMIHKFKASQEHERSALEDLEHAVKGVGQWIEHQGVERSLFDMKQKQGSRGGGVAVRASQVITDAQLKLKSTMSRLEDFAQHSKAMDTVSKAVGKFKQATCSMVGSRQGQEILYAFEGAKTRIIETPPDKMALLGDLSHMPLAEMEEDLTHLVLTSPTMDPYMIKAMREVFLNLVNMNYWRFIEAGDVVPGTSEAEALLCSIKLALGSTDLRMTDLKNILKIVKMHKHHHKLSACSNDGQQSQPSVNIQETFTRHTWQCRKVMLRMVESVAFQCFIMCLIMSNAVFIALEDYYKSDTNEADIGWITADVIFSGLFLTEFIMKFISFGRGYFMDAWNNVDFALVVLGIGSIILNMLAKEFAKHHDVAGESRLVRLARVLRVLRLMRVFRLLTYGRALLARVLYRMEFSKQVAESVQNITILSCFVKAHAHSQREILFFFGRDGKVHMPELARVMVESMLECYLALSITVDELMELEMDVVQAMNVQKRSKSLAESLDVFVQGATDKGVITAREAEKLLKPVHRHLRSVKQEITGVHLGYVRSRSTSRNRISEGTDEDVQDEHMVPDIHCWDCTDGEELLESDHGFLITKRPMLEVPTDCGPCPTASMGCSSRASAREDLTGFRSLNPQAVEPMGEIGTRVSVRQNRLSQRGSQRGSQVASELNGNGSTLNGHNGEMHGKRGSTVSQSGFDPKRMSVTENRLAVARASLKVSDQRPVRNSLTVQGQSSSTNEALLSTPGQDEKARYIRRSIDVPTFPGVLIEEPGAKSNGDCSPIAEGTKHPFAMAGCDSETSLATNGDGGGTSKITCKQ